jgi:hypothetical protein
MTVRLDDPNGNQDFIPDVAEQFRSRGSLVNSCHGISAGTECCVCQVFFLEDVHRFESSKQSQI